MFDLHTHSIVSDGTDTPTELVERAARIGLAGLALCDHDVLDGIAEAHEAGARVGVQVIAGVELSATFRGADIHVLGYGMVPDHELSARLEWLREGRRQRIPRMMSKLHALGVELTVDEVIVQARGHSIGRPHIADALVAKGIVADRDEAFARWLDNDGPAYVPKPAVELGEAIDLLHRSGAAVVIAHPRIRSVGSVLTDEVLAGLVTEHGLDGIEADHPMHNPDTRDELHQLAGDLGILATGASDCHGAGKKGHDLGSVTTPGHEVAELGRIVAAHGGHL